MVYFIQEDRTDGLIKVGEANRLFGRDGRLQVLNQGNPYGFKVIATIFGNKGFSQLLEKQILADLQTFNFRGEWFNADPKVLDYIKNIPHVRMHPGDEKF